MESLKLNKLCLEIPKTELTSQIFELIKYLNLYIKNVITVKKIHHLKNMFITIGQ